MMLAEFSIYFLVAWIFLWIGVGIGKASEAAKWRKNAKCPGVRISSKGKLYSVLPGGG